MPQVLFSSPGIGPLTYGGPRTGTDGTPCLEFDKIAYWTYCSYDNAEIIPRPGGA